MGESEKYFAPPPLTADLCDSHKPRPRIKKDGIFSETPEIESEIEKNATVLKFFKKSQKINEDEMFLMFEGFRSV